MQCTVTVNDVQYVSAVQVFDPFTAKVSFTEEASQEVSIIEHLQSKHEASDLLVSTSTTHKLEYGTPRRDIFERSDISLATTKNTNNFPLKIGPLMLILSQYHHDHAKFGQAILTRTNLPFCLSYSFLQGHPTTVFCKISVRRSKYCLEFSITWGRIKISRLPFHSCTIFKAYLTNSLRFSEV